MKMHYDSFWNNIIADSKNLEEPVLYPQFFETPFISEDDVKSIFQNTQAFHDSAFKDLRVFIEKGESKHFAYELLNHLNQEGKSIQDQLLSHFGGKTFGVIVNSVEKYSEPLAHKIVRMLQPLLCQYKIPQFVHEIVAFIGNYGYTPVGIHYDFDNTRVLHFHLGPGEKEIIVWDREKLQPITKGKSQYYCSEEEIKRLISLGTSYKLKSNDLFLLPSQKYHIGNTPTFSIDLCIFLQKKEKKKFYRGLVSDFIGNHVDMDSENKEEMFLSIDEQFSDFGQFHNQLPSLHAIAATNDAYTLKVKSNMGLKYPPVANHSEIPLRPESRIRVNEPFKMILSDKGEYIDLFVRGKQMALPKIIELVDFIHDINEGKEVSVTDYINRLSEECEEETSLQILKWLFQYRGITLQ